jgi:hypothetical protein
MIEYRNHLIVFLSDLNRSVLLLLSQISQKFVCFFFLVRIVNPTPNPKPGGPVLRIYVPRRQGGPAKHLGTVFPFQSPLTTRRHAVLLFFSAPNGKYLQLGTLSAQKTDQSFALSCHNLRSLCTICNFM